MRIEREDFTPELYEELHELFLQHNDETFSTLGDLDPNLEFYFLMKEHGVLDTIVAREDGRVVGYMLTTTSYNHHHQTVLVGAQDVFFVHKDYRKGSVGTKIIKKAEEVLIDKGVDVISMFYSESMDLSRYYEKLGYKPMEHSVFKRIGD